MRVPLFFSSWLNRSQFTPVISLVCANCACEVDFGHFIVTVFQHHHDALVAEQKSLTQLLGQESDLKASSAAATAARQTLATDVAAAEKAHAQLMDTLSTLQGQQIGISMTSQVRIRVFFLVSGWVKPMGHGVFLWRL